MLGRQWDEAIKHAQAQAVDSMDRQQRLAASDDAKKRRVIESIAKIERQKKDDAYEPGPEWLRGLEAYIHEKKLPACEKGEMQNISVVVIGDDKVGKTSLIDALGFQGGSDVRLKGAVSSPTMWSEAAYALTLTPTQH